MSHQAGAASRHYAKQTQRSCLFVGMSRLISCVPRCGATSTRRSCSQRSLARRKRCSVSGENLLWGAPRIHGELLKLGFELAQLAQLAQGKQCEAMANARSAKLIEEIAAAHSKFDRVKPIVEKLGGCLRCMCRGIRMRGKLLHGVVSSPAL